VPEFIKNLLWRTEGRIEASGERCVASNESITLATNIVLVSKEVIARSRAQIARTEHHAPVSRMRNHSD
jgi:hypothetical protein